MTNEAFIRAAKAIAAEKPVYRTGGSGADGTCDCIGLVIGAVRRCGVRWAKAGAGAHSSNWAARHRVWGLCRLAEAQVQAGDLVFKARQPGEAGYALPPRYGRGGVDYYHVGIVISTEPPCVLHCTGGRVNGCEELSSLSGWTHAARLTLLKDK